MEHSNDDENTYYLMEKEPIVNRFISIPRDKSSLNCAVFIAGIIEAVLVGTGFVCFVYIVCCFGAIRVVFSRLKSRPIGIKEQPT